MSIDTIDCWFNELNKGIEGIKAKINAENVDIEDAVSFFNKLVCEVRDERGTVWWVGNGGSNSICSHLAQDMLGKLNLSSHAINDPSLLTCISNDFGYEESFARPLRVISKQNDLILAISSSGNSENILRCVEEAQKNGIKTITVSGFKDNNKLWSSPSSLSFYYPTEHYGTVEVGHMAFLHALIEVQYFSETGNQK